jgi:predicted XRE-type DNA-binding protein
VKQRFANRFPTADLIDFASHLIGNESASQEEIAPVLGVQRSTLSLWKIRDQRFTIWQADKYACRLGVHPSEIWSDYWNVSDDYLTGVA